MMRTYQFIKYGDNTSLEKLISQTKNSTTLCFDFEDSIQNCINTSNTHSLKTIYRNCFKSIIEKSRLDINTINIGIRLNTMDSSEYLCDLSAIDGIKHISTVFLPKTSGPGQVQKLQNDLQKIGLSYNEIIPVVETKTGMNNLSEILNMNSARIMRIAFGHCDYNFDNDNYPYFHQDSREYWSWITKLSELIKPYNLDLVNSPLLELDNDELFVNMISILYSICGDNSRQITLTKKQTGLCNSFNENKAKIILPTIVNRLDSTVPGLYAERFIESFEKNCNDKGFVLNGNRTILSPQEYSSSLNYRDKADFPVVNFTFVGGCFPVQGSLCFEDLFHQKLKRKIENNRKLKFNINIIRYENFKKCILKISSYAENKPIDIIVFSIRPEPFLRQVKLYYKFASNNGKKWSLNLPLFNIFSSEKHLLPDTVTRYNPTVAGDSSLFHKGLINLNYIFGILLRNDNYAIKEYLKLIKDVIEFCNRNNIELVILGPPVRSNTNVERFLSLKLERFSRKFIKISPVKYISGSGLVNNGEKLFMKNGIHANEKYHAIIAERMFETIMPTIDKIATEHRQN